MSIQLTAVICITNKSTILRPSVGQKHILSR